MKIAVRYQSRSGNTRKVAEAIARELGAEAKPLSAAEQLREVDLLFIGGALYAGKFDSVLQKTLEALTLEQARAVAFFSTSAAPKPMLPLAKKAIKDARVTLLDDAFHCQGKFLIAFLSHPNAQDLAAAAAFARRTADACAEQGSQP